MCLFNSKNCILERYRRQSSAPPKLKFGQQNACKPFRHTERSKIHFRGCRPCSGAGVRCLCGPAFFPQADGSNDSICRSRTVSAARRWRIQLNFRLRRLCDAFLQRETAVLQRHFLAIQGFRMGFDELHPAIHDLPLGGLRLTAVLVGGGRAMRLYSGGQGVNFGLKALHDPVAFQKGSTLFAPTPAQG